MRRYALILTAAVLLLFNSSGVAPVQQITQRFSSAIMTTGQQIANEPLIDLAVIHVVVVHRFFERIHYLRFQYALERHD